MNDGLRYLMTSSFMLDPSGSWIASKLTLWHVLNTLATLSRFSGANSTQKSGVPALVAP
jgi:hypothetical protein